MHMPQSWNPGSFGYESMTQNWVEVDKFRIPSRREKLEQKYVHPRLRFLLKKENPLPEMISYRDYVESYPEDQLKDNEYPWIFADWDNTPRCGVDGWLFDGATPEKFGELCVRAFKSTENKPPEEKFVILRSWNEWAEGNYLEPDNRYGTRYLEQFKKSLEVYSNLHVDTIQKLSSD
jgi:hypothetical protein